MTKQLFALGELFVGPGGMALGAEQAKLKGYGYKHVWATDNDQNACATFQRNFNISNDRVICCDVADLNLDSLAPIDGLVFGFPCNDFSIVGEKKGISGKYGGLYQFGVNALMAKKPLFFVAENVSGIKAKGDEFASILKAIRGAGYDTFEKIYRFEEYGVPQKRHRMIIVGFRKNLKLKFQQPTRTHLGKFVTAREALAKISPDTANHKFHKNSSDVTERLKHIKPGQNVFTANVPPRLQIKMRSDATISQIYKRLEANKPAYTVTGSGGGGTYMYHWEENRALTNRERARLQTFPDSFVFEGSIQNIRKQVGMAVPPLGAKVIFKEVLKTLIENNIESQCV